MFRRGLLSIALLVCASLGVPGFAQTEEVTVPQAPALSELRPLVLEERVPRRWLHNNPDQYPLQPARWRRRVPRRCRTQGGYRQHCSGPRRIPQPQGPAADLAEHLGLGHRWTARWVMHKRPFEEWMAAVEHLDPRGRLTFPVPGGRMGRGFGRNRRGSISHRRHNGVDIGAPEGHPIVAARDGLVVYAGNELTGYGNIVILLHHEGYSTMYAHCRDATVFAGQYVGRGQTIAHVGDTGFAWAPHLHFEWRQRGWVRDPGRHFLPDENPLLPPVRRANEEGDS
ncbi:MAG: M23 family metallopeptidase [Deltaproteobacteria bacterium]|nr:M23 family metallopeptidase [Deltaproteobacteria bacterium]